MLSLFQLYSRRSLLHFWFRLSFLFSPRKTISKIPLSLSSSSMIKQTKRKQDWNKRKWRAPMGEQSKRWAWVNWSRLSRFDSAGELHRVPDDEINSIAKSAVCRKSGRKSTEGIRDTETMMMSIVGLPLGKWKHRRHSCLSLSLSLFLSFSLCCKLHGYTKPRGNASAVCLSRVGKNARGSECTRTIECHDRKSNDDSFCSRFFFAFVTIQRCWERLKRV